MKKTSTILNLVLAGSLALTLLAFSRQNTPALAAQPTPQATSSESTSCDSGRTVQVSGTAVVTVVPDRVLIQLGVQSNGRNPEAVQSTNAAAIQRVINAIKTLGVEPKDIATDWYIIEPVYEDYDSLYIKGYRINNVVAVTLRQVNNVSEVIATAFEAGANQVVNVEFYTSDLRKYRDQARQMAMQAASEKAVALAGAAGAETGCVLNISENSWASYNGWWYGRGNQNLWTQNAVQNAAPNPGEGQLSETGPVSLGQISVRAEVSATFGLK